MRELTIAELDFEMAEQLPARELMGGCCQRSCNPCEQQCQPRCEPKCEAKCEVEVCCVTLTAGLKL
jgi:hypothetical protein